MEKEEDGDEEEIDDNEAADDNLYKYTRLPILCRNNK